jgi:signal transduction histidine kinase
MSALIKIVVIDDSEDDRLLYRRTLMKSTDATYEVIEASDGEEGLRCIAEEKPACVLLDYSLPGRNGVEILKTARSRHPFMPVVMLTGQGNEKVAVTAIQLGAQNYIAKSTITLETLQHVIRIAVDHCQLEKRIDEQRTSLEIFTRALAHDLKEPVRAIHLFTELIVQAQENLSEKSGKYFQRIQNATDRMRILIDSVFSYTRLDAPDQAVKETCSVVDVIKEAQDNLAQLINEYEATVTHGELPRIYVNRIQLTQVLQNLIANAINHSQTPVCIHVDTEEQAQSWLFRVKDDGPGIESVYLKKIFEPFRRLGHEERPGAGLGLAICQRVVESHNGTIWCESIVGQGATFFFTLAKTVPQTAEPTPIRQAG